METQKTYKTKKSIRSSTKNERSNIMAKIGAIFYIIWGLLHLKAAYGIYLLGAEQTPSVVQGRLWQDAFFLFLISFASIFIALKYNWSNNRLGYWLNFFIVGIEDLLFIFLIVIPGYVPFEMLFTGPLVWVLGLVFSSLALMNKTGKS